MQPSTNDRTCKAVDGFRDALASGLHRNVLVRVEVDAGVVASKQAIGLRLARVVGRERVLLPEAAAAAASSAATPAA